VVLAGDISWAMTLNQALADFDFIESLPGRKVIIKGNHDYWWSSRAKMEAFFDQNGLKSMTILHNSCVCQDGLALCGTRGWMLEDGTEHDHKLTAREEGRLRTSLDAASKTGLETGRVSFIPADIRGFDLGWDDRPDEIISGKKMLLRPSARRRVPSGV
jgi:predicted phosphohydrolase